MLCQLTSCVHLCSFVFICVHLCSYMEISVDVIVCGCVDLCVGDFCNTTATPQQHHSSTTATPTLQAKLQMVA